MIDSGIEAKFFEQHFSGRRRSHSLARQPASRVAQPVNQPVYLRPSQQLA
jgi:hypothetical protein